MRFTAASLPALASVAWPLTNRLCAASSTSDHHAEDGCVGKNLPNLAEILCLMGPTTRIRLPRISLPIRLGSSTVAVSPGEVGGGQSEKFSVERFKSPVLGRYAGNVLLRRLWYFIRQEFTRDVNIVREQPTNDGCAADGRSTACPPDVQTVLGRTQR